MLHTNFQGHQPFGSREFFLRLLLYMGMVATIWSCDLDHLNKLSFPHPMQAPPISLVVKKFENVESE